MARGFTRMQLIYADIPLRAFVKILCDPLWLIKTYFKIE
jgi:hypothetical protein